MEDIACFLLTRGWRDGPHGLEIELWGASERGPVRLRLTDQEAVCFVEREHRPPPAMLERVGARSREVALATLAGRPVDALYFRRQRDMVAAREALGRGGTTLLESDVRPAERFLMERFVTAGLVARGAVEQRRGWLEMVDPAVRAERVAVDLRALAVDIETDGLDGPVLGIAAHRPGCSVAWVSRAGGAPDPQPDATAATDVDLRMVDDERALLVAFLEHVRGEDPDLILGWNVVAFDLAVLETRCRALGLEFSLGRGGESATVLPGGREGMRVARVPGRAVLDGIEALRAAFWSFESFELDAVAQVLLGRGKHIDTGVDRVEEVRRLHREDPAGLGAYNIEDCRLVAAIFERTALVPFLVRRAELTGLALDRYGGSVAAFDNLYLPRLHRRGRVAPDVRAVHSSAPSPGGYVLDSRPGLYDNVLLLDFKSLYPSIIRTFRIDPFGLAAPGDDPVPGFAGASFAREGGILPELVATLLAEREAAKRRGDAPLSQAVKILMNSFYGVLGASGCRFHDHRLASSITRRGHAVIGDSRDHLEALGHTVIYGDTDSLFVLLGAGPDEVEARAVGARIAAELNAWWRQRVAAEYRLESFLEIEFETHFLRFLMPTVRGESTGSKKRYAGLVRGRDGALDLVFKGLESVRTDWTPLARRFQRELYRRVFLGEPFEAYVRDVVAELEAGRLDHELVYRKRLRRPLDAYQRNVPPHVQAARKLGRRVRTVEYLMTPTGPEPVGPGLAPRPDYGHYRERQLAPAADGILHFLGSSFAAITDNQLGFFADP
ncbi:MAG: DNA polymerase II [Chromatiales bacterium]|nr:DNA polymerase II [Chromatiales bacterium]